VLETVIVSAARPGPSAAAAGPADNKNEIPTAKLSQMILAEDLTVREDSSYCIIQ
jgi:hypothetical protein